MKAQTTLQNAVGKTLTDYAETQWGQLLLIFGEEYVCLGVKRGYDPGDEEIVESKLDLFGGEDETLIAKGVISQDEMETLKAKHAAQQQLHQKAKEQAAYKRLREKLYHMTNTTIKIGDRVTFLVPEPGEWDGKTLPTGTVTELYENAAHIAFDDGDEGWESLASLELISS